MQNNFKIDLTEEFDDFEPEVDAVSVDGMKAIIDSIECGIEPTPIIEGTQLTKDSKPAADKPLHDQSKAVAVANNSENTKTGKQGIFEKMFPTITEHMKHIFRKLPESLEKLLGFYNIESHAKQIAEKLNEYPDSYKTQSILIDNQIVPGLVSIYNHANKNDNIEMPNSENNTESPRQNSSEPKEGEVGGTPTEANGKTGGNAEFADAEIVDGEEVVQDNGSANDGHGNGQNDRPNGPTITDENDNNQQQSQPNKPKDYTVKLPKGFNQPPANLGERCTSMRLGYPMINFNSETVKEMLKPATDIDFLKTLTKEFVKETENTPIANALGTRLLFKKWKKIVQRVRDCGRSKCIPVVHKPLKISGLENIQTLFQGTNSNNINKVFVNPINTRSSQITESLDSMKDDALIEGWIQTVKNGVKNRVKDVKNNVKSFINNGQTGDNSNMEADGLEVPIPYLAQFYEIRSPSTKQGLEQYTRYMSKKTMKEICNDIGPEEVEAAKNHNELSFKAAILFEYISKHDGILPYYILTQRRNPKEQLKVTPKPLLRDLYFVKSVDGPNKAVGYFVSKEERQQLFELG